MRAARAFAAGVDRITLAWPAAERHGGLVDQVRGKAAAGAASILLALEAETAAERRDHLSAANGAYAAAESHLLIARNLAYSDEPTVAALLALSADLGLLLHDEIAATRERDPRGASGPTPPPMPALATRAGRAGI